MKNREKTGIKDINNVDICEDDLLKGVLKLNNEKKTYIFKVYYKSDMACMWAENINDKSHNSALFRVKAVYDIEVIGNIHTNMGKTFRIIE
jgi:hypothetical protein